MVFTKEFCWKCKHLVVCRFYPKIMESELNDIITGCKFFEPREEVEKSEHT